LPWKDMKQKTEFTLTQWIRPTHVVRVAHAVASLAILQTLTIVDILMPFLVSR
jgi:hypothetical protein